MQMRTPILIAVLSLAAACASGVTESPAGDAGVDARFTDVLKDILIPETAVFVDQKAVDSGHDVLFDTHSDLAPEFPILGCDPGEGCFMDKCDENGDCQSSWCVEHLGEGVCTKTCQEECPPGWKCKQVGGTDPDVIFICVSDHANLCKPCEGNADCDSAGGAQDVCVAYGDEGSFCGGSCAADNDCPWGFSCLATTTVDDIETMQCVADAGVCPCTDKSVELSLWTPCESTTDWGTCTGKRVCTDDGLSGCDAPVPVEEVCNGLDDNCDGNIDEPHLVEGDFVNLCDDGNECTEDKCMGNDGCVNEVLDAGPCEDGDPCTVADHCVDGTCMANPVKCEDDNPCTDNVCTETGGCEYPSNSALCDDDDPCTLADQCVDGACKGTPVPCDCQTNDECGEFEDGDLCNGTLVCDTAQYPYKCVVSPETIVTCPAPEGDNAFCLQPHCEAVTGECSFVPNHEAFLCDNADACTVNTKCVEGTCLGGAQVNCNDGNPCTDDSCDPAEGCAHANNAAPCTDGDVCTTLDTCNEGECTPGPLLDCDDGDACNGLETCDTATGCKAAAPLECNDNNPCNGIELCDPVDGCQGGDEVDCADGNVCTDDICDPMQGCVHTALTGHECEDGNACTELDICQDGLCVGSGVPECDDDNPCTDNVCDPAQGCVTILNKAFCDDGDICTTGDHCDLGDCLSGGELPCDDDNSCTDDSCEPEVGCEFVPNQGECDDGNVCTEGDVCAGGWCLGGETCGEQGSYCTDMGCLYEDCAAVLAHTPEVEDGVYWIKPDGLGPNSPFEVNCDMTTDGGGWTLAAVSSDDGQHTWTWSNRHYWDTDTTVFGSLQALDKDYKSRALHEVKGGDVMFVHSPSGVWAAYYGVGEDSQPLAEAVGEVGGPICWQPGDGHEMAAGTLAVAEKLCSTSLYFNVEDWDGKGGCGLDNSNNSYGPTWSSGGNGSCPFDDPGTSSSLGPTTGSNVPGPGADTEYGKEPNMAMGFGWALDVNSGDAGAAENYMRVFVRPCTPFCEGKECGGDGCGGDCGECDEGHNCTKGICVCGSIVQPAVSWEATLGGAENDRAGAVTVTPDGYVAVGTTNSQGAGKTDLWLAKFDGNGNQLWEKLWGGTEQDVGSDVLSLDDGGLAISGWTMSDGAQGPDGWLIRTDADGNPLWEQTYGGKGSDEPRVVVAMPDGGFALAGETTTNSAGGWDFWLVRTDSEGNLLWQQTFGTADEDWPCLDLVALPDGGFAIAGGTKSNGATHGDVWLLRTDDKGNLLWDKTYGGTEKDYAYGIVLLSDGGFALGGITDSKGAGNRDFWLLRTDAAGNLMWDATYGGPSSDGADDLVLMPDGGFAMVGFTASSGAGSYDALLVRTDKKGNLLWQATYGTTGMDWANSLAVAPGGRFVFVGYTPDGDGTSDDAWILVTETECCVPQCEDKECGDDGCGGSCGACAENWQCDGTGMCVDSGGWFDPASGLIWQNPCAAWAMKWSEAKFYCDNLSLAGHDDWRLPNVAELRTIVRGCQGSEANGSCNIEDGDCVALSCKNNSCTGCTEGEGPAAGCYWPDELQGECYYFWSSSAVEDIAGASWVVNYNTSKMLNNNIDGPELVRCVRGLQ